PAFDRSLDEIGSEECKRDRHVDLADAAALAFGDVFDVQACVIDKLLEPTTPTRDRGDEGCAGLRADRTSVLGLDGIRHEYLPPPFRQWLMPRDVKGEVTRCAAFASLRLDELDDQLTRLDFHARNVGVDEASISN